MLRFDENPFLKYKSKFINFTLVTHLAPDTWHLEPGTLHLTPGTWHLAL